MKDARYDGYTDELVILEQMLVLCPNQDGKANLRHLLSAHAKREAIAIRFAFKQGFCGCATAPEKRDPRLR